MTQLMLTWLMFVGRDLYDDTALAQHITTGNTGSIILIYDLDDLYYRNLSVRSVDGSRTPYHRTGTTGPVDDLDRDL